MEEEEECLHVHQHSNDENNEQQQHQQVAEQQPPEIDSNDEQKSPLPLQSPENNEQQQQLTVTEIASEEILKPLSVSEIDPIHTENEKLAGNNGEQPPLITQSSPQDGDSDENNRQVNDNEADVAVTEKDINEDVASVNVVVNESLVVSVDVPVDSMVTADVPTVAATAEAEAVTSVVAEEGPSSVDEVASMAAQVAHKMVTEAEDAGDVSVMIEGNGLAPIVDSSTDNVSPKVDSDSSIGDAPPVIKEEDSASKVDGSTGDVSLMVQDDNSVTDVSPTSQDNDSAPKVDGSTDDASPMIQDVDLAPKVDGSTGDASSMIQDEDSAPVVDDSTKPEVDGHPSTAVNDSGDHMEENQVGHVSEADTEMEVETEPVETPTSSGKRKRGRPAKNQTKVPQAKAHPPKKVVEEEDVCFICFDGGNLVLCDRRGCPKAYHPACVNRDEAFFRSKGRWNCGWHICSNCEKGAHYMCYTCTYSLCKGCIKETEFFCVRGNKGFCETCMRTVMLIEKNEQAQVNFDDKSSWEFLFKEYWVDLKGKLELTPDELTQAKNPMKGSNTSARKAESSEELYDANDDKGSETDGSSEHLEVNSSKKKKARGRPRKDVVPPSTTHVPSGGISLSTDADWASKELLEFVAHMKNGDKSVLTQYDVQALLLEYIKQNNLRDPRKKSQIVCDSRLENLFGKSRVAHFEMLKLLESHFLIKEDNRADDIARATTEAEASHLDGDGSTGASAKVSSDKRRKSRKKGDGRGPQTNLDDYAAIDVHNIKLLYLRRNLMEDLLEDTEQFHDKVVGSFVRIRISGSGAKQDMYRLVQVAGTRKATEPYKTGKRIADVVLEIQNLNKTEVISIDTISNQEFSEDECKRLRQSIKFGLISRMTVGEVQDKAMSLQAVRVNDWLEMEKLRISHLRDRASEQGRRKDLRECVEKLELLNTTEERFRRLEEIPEVHADPNMDPNYESEEDEDEDEKSQDKSTMSRDAGFSRKLRDPISPGKGSPGSVDTWSASRKSVTTSFESGRNASTTGAWERGYGANGAGESASSDARPRNSWENTKSLASPTGLATGALSGHTLGQYGPSPGNSPTPAAPLPTPAANISETDKMWHYKDPSGKIQGPFSMVQLRKWSTTGHFPADLRIWRTTERPEDSILLNDALAGKYTVELRQTSNSLSLPVKAEALPEVNRVSSWEGNNTAVWTDKNQIDRTVNSSGRESGSNAAWTDRTQMDRANTPWAGRNINDRAPNSSWNNNSGFANGTTQPPNNDAWGIGSSNWGAPAMDPKVEQSGHSFQGGWNSRGNHAWGGRPVHNPPNSASPYPGQPQRPAFHQGGQHGGRWNRDQNRGGNNWNSNRYRGQQPNNNWRGGGYDRRENNMGGSGPTSGDSWRVTVETPKPATDGWNSNLPSPTPNKSELNWTNQASANPWSPTPAAQAQQASGWNEPQPVSAAASGGWGSAPKAADGRGDFTSPPSPTPASAPFTANHVNP